MLLDLSSFEKALDSLRTALRVYESTEKSPETSTDKVIEREMMRDGIIQRFEYTFELSWKMLKRYLEMYGLEKPDGFSAKQLFRVGFERGLLREVEPWFVYLENRNHTSHTYNAETAERVYNVAKDFLQDAEFLLTKLQEKAT